MNKETIDCQVVMLPTEGKCRIAGKPTEKGQVPEGYRCYSHTGLLKRITKFFANGTPDPDYNTLYLNGYPNPEYNGYSEEYWHPQHLYFTSNEEIKGGDWIVEYSYKGNIVFPIVEQYTSKSKFPTSHAKKIVASTDPSLGLPAIPESFLKQYVAAGGKIDKVRLKYHEASFRPGGCTCTRLLQSQGCFYSCKKPILELTEANEVVVVESTQYLEVQTPAECLKELECIGQDKELEEAAKEWVDSFYQKEKEYSKVGRNKCNPQSGFIAGAEWQKEQSVTEAIEFATWVMQQKFDYLVGKSYEKLYELWQKSKKK